MLAKGQFSVTATKKSVPATVEVAGKLDSSFPTLKSSPSANYFVEI